MSCLLYIHISGLQGFLWEAETARGNEIVLSQATMIFSFRTGLNIKCH